MFFITTGMLSDETSKAKEGKKISCIKTKTPKKLFSDEPQKAHMIFFQLLSFTQRICNRQIYHCVEDKESRKTIGRFLGFDGK